MVAFDAEADLDQDVAFGLMRNGFVALFRRRAVLDEATTWLDERGYQVTRVDASRWRGDADLHRDIARALDFPDYYGWNLDALNDCLGDVVDHRYGWSPDATGLVLVFTGYDAFARCSPRTAHVVLDIVAGKARSAALFGRRLLCLVQSDDPDIEFESVGATPVLWNDAEWVDADRRADR